MKEVDEPTEAGEVRRGGEEGRITTDAFLRPIHEPATLAKKPYQIQREGFNEKMLVKKGAKY
jgi:hypothetical protein